MKLQCNPGEDALAGEAILLRRGVRLQVAHHAEKALALVFLHGGLSNWFNWDRNMNLPYLRGGKC